MERVPSALDACLAQRVKIALGAEHAAWIRFVVELLQCIRGDDYFLDDFGFRIVYSSPRHLGKGPFLAITSTKMSTHATANDMGTLQYVRSRIDNSNNPVFTGDSGSRISKSLVGDCPSSSIFVPLYDPIVLEEWRKEKERLCRIEEERLQTRLAEARVPYWGILGCCVAIVVIGVVVYF